MQGGEIPEMPAIDEGTSEGKKGGEEDKDSGGCSETGAAYFRESTREG